MDKTTYQVRSANWKAVIEQCQARPEGQTAKKWLADNNVSEKQYYYWLRKFRKEAFDEMKSPFPAAALPASDTSRSVPAVSYAEFSTEGILEREKSPAIVIRTSKSTIEISSEVSDKVVIQLMKAVAHAL